MKMEQEMKEILVGLRERYFKKHIKSNFQSFVSKEKGITEKHGDEIDRIT